MTTYLLHTKNWLLLGKSLQTGIDWIESLMVSRPPFQKYKSGCSSATAVVNSLNTQQVENTEEDDLMTLLWVFIVISIIF